MKRTVVHQRHPELTWIAVAYQVWTAADDITDYPYATILLDASGTELGRVTGDGADLTALLAKAR